MRAVRLAALFLTALLLTPEKPGATRGEAWHLQDEAKRHNRFRLAASGPGGELEQVVARRQRREEEFNLRKPHPLFVAQTHRHGNGQRLAALIEHAGGHGFR